MSEDKDDIMPADEAIERTKHSLPGSTEHDAVVKATAKRFGTTEEEVRDMLAAHGF